MWRDPRAASRRNRDRAYACPPPILPRFFGPLYHWLADHAQVIIIIIRHFHRQRHHATNAASEPRVLNMQVREHGTGDAMDEAVFSGAGKIEDSQAWRRN